MDFEKIEGIKTIKNDKHLIAEDIANILEEYKNIIGDISFELELEDANLIIDFEGIYRAKITVEEDTNEIIIERKKDDESINMSDSDAITKAKANRLIEQIYDLIKDYMEDGIITEHITELKKELDMCEETKSILGGVIPVGNKFKIMDNTKKVLYEADEEPLTNTYSLRNLETKREEVVINYSKYKEKEYSITLQPFEHFVFAKNSLIGKTLFTAKTGLKEIKISGDYTDNHFLIELNEIVVGSIDCLDPQSKFQYKIGIYDLEKENIIIAIAILLDTYMRKEDDIQHKKEILRNIKNKYNL